MLHCLFQVGDPSYVAAHSLFSGQAPPLTRDRRLPRSQKMLARNTAQLKPSLAMVGFGMQHLKTALRICHD